MKKLLLAIASLGLASAAQAQTLAITMVQDAAQSESTTAGQSITTKTYTSPPVTVTIVKRYVDKNRIFKLGGSQIFPSTTTQNLCTSSYTPCTSGQTVTGGKMTANLGQLGNGQVFFFQSTNVYSPFQTYSTQITIK